MKIIFFTFALLAVTNANFLRKLDATELGDAKFSTTCTDFTTLKVTFTLPSAASAAIDATKLTLEGNETGTKTSVTIPCTAVAKDATELVCGGAPETGSNPADGVAYKVKSIADAANFSIGTQTSTVTYNKKYLALGTNADQTVDYDDDAKKTFTVTYAAAFADTDTLPEIKVGTEVVSCELNADNKKQLTCTPNKDKIEKKEEAYQITAKNACATYDNVAKLTVTGASAFLKASLALLVAVFLF